MDANEARRVIESLRYGLPPAGHIGDFTVGRSEEIDDLRKQLRNDQSNVLLLNANYGAGKTHLLQFIREEALRNNWMVSLVTLDSKSGVRFDQLSQIIGAICRNLEIPGRSGKGVRQLLDAFRDSAIKGTLNGKFWSELHNNGKWDRRRHFETEAFFIGLRAWFFCDHYMEDHIENWFQSPHMNSDGRATHLYKDLIEGMRQHYRDARPKQYFSKERLDLTRNDDLCWGFMRDLQRSAKAMGLKGLVLCFDEFEDIIYNLTRTNRKKMAFCNMFELFYGHQFRSHAYFAVTPGFVQKCKEEFARRGEYDYDFSLFDGLKQFEMSPITLSDMQTLIGRIVRAYETAFSYTLTNVCEGRIWCILLSFEADSNQDRVRQCIRDVVQELDRSLEE